jgi:flagellar protein FliS
MSNQRALSGYQQTSAIGASALGQVVALYEAILRDFRLAIAALEQGQIEKRVHHVDHALLILAELQNVLDFEKGGEAAKRLNGFYNVTRAEITKVSVSPSREGFQRLIDLFMPVHQAWVKVSRELPPTPPRDAAPTVRVTMNAPATSPASQFAGEPQISASLWSA